MNIDDFFLNIKPSRNFSTLLDDAYFDEMPNSWYLVRCEIKHCEDEAIIFRSLPLFVSTVLNLAQTKHSIPYCIDTNACNILIPPTILSNVKAVLELTCTSLFKKYQMKTEVNLIGYTELKSYGKQVLVGRLILQDDLQQALFVGGGLKYFAKIVQTNTQYQLGTSLLKIPPNYFGFDCSLADISADGKLLKIIVDVVDDRLQREFFSDILNLLGRQKIMDTLMLELADEVLQERELDLKDINGFVRVKSLVQKTLDNVRIKNGILTGGISYEAYMENMKNHCITTVICDRLVIFALSDSVQTQKLLPFLKELFKNGVVKFQVEAVQSLQIQGLFYKSELKAYYLQSVRR